MNYIEKESQQISNWIKDIVVSANASGVVLGLSGGIDSAVVAALCKKTFPNNTLCLIMPCYSDTEDEEHARLIAKKLDLEVKKIDLNPIYDSFRKEAGALFDESKYLLGNVKSRLRMITLYYFAANYNYLVAGPTNKSEFMIGYFTKHGDSGADIMPIADYIKKEIFELAKFLGIPEEIINKTPTAGLWAGQTDEEEMEFTYNQLDNYIIQNDTDLEVKNKIEGMILRSKHKRNFPKIYRRSNKLI